MARRTGKESRGAHAREDYPRARRRQLDEAHAGLGRRRQRTVTLDYRPVHAYTLTNDVSYSSRRRGSTERSDGRRVQTEPWSEFTLPANSQGRRRQDLAGAAGAQEAAPSSASIAGTRTTTPIRASTPITSIATTADRWSSTR